MRIIHAWYMSLKWFIFQTFVLFFLSKTPISPSVVHIDIYIPWKTVMSKPTPHS